MKTLFVIYDSECGFCCRCRQWLEQQAAFLKFYFIPRNSPEVIQRFPGIEEFLGLEELIVVSDEGDVYHGAHAWVMCFCALQKYREWSYRLAHPSLLPLARQTYEIVSKNRSEFSQWMRFLPENRPLSFVKQRENHENEH